MKAAKKVTQTISVVAAIIMIIIVLFMKYGYYVEKYKSGWFSNQTQAIIWSIISMMISVTPLAVFVIGNIIDTIGKNDKIQMITVIASVIIALLNIAFEIVSILGAAMTLNNSWGDMAESMITYHLLSFIPLLIGIVSIILTAKINKAADNNT